MDNPNAKLLDDLKLENQLLKRLLDANRVKLANLYVSLVDAETLLELEKEKVIELINILKSQSSDTGAESVA